MKIIKDGGFTLIELTLYIALVAILIGTLIPLATNITSVADKIEAQQEVQTSARYLSEKIKYAIRISQGINVDSTFNTNLATNSTKYLSLIGAAPNDPMIFRVSSSMLYMQIGTGIEVPLNSPTIQVTNLTFYNNSTGASSNISFVLSLKNNYSGSDQTYNYSVNIRSSAEIRE